MNRSLTRQFYQSRPWRGASLACRERAGWLCGRCKAEGFTVAAALAHHRVAVTKGGAKLDPANLEALCFDCHEKEHGRANEEKRAWGRYLQELMDTL